MTQENYVEECSTQRPHLLEPNRFCFWKARFETYVKSKDIDLWQVIQNGDFYFEIEDGETKLMKEMPYELLKYNEKKQLGKNEEAKITIYNALPKKSTSESSCVKPQRSNSGNRFGEGRNNSFKDKGGESSKKKGACYNCVIEGHFSNECRKLKENKDFMRGAWCDSEDNDEHQNDVTCLMAIDSQKVVSKPSSSNIDLNFIDLQMENDELLKFNKDFTKTFEKLVKVKRAIENKNSKLLSKINDFEIEVKKLANDKEVVEPCQKCVELTQEVDSSTSNVSKPQDEALNFSKFKSSVIALDDMLSHQKLSQDKEGEMDNPPKDSKTKQKMTNTRSTEWKKEIVKDKAKFKAPNDQSEKSKSKSISNNFNVISAGCRNLNAMTIGCANLKPSDGTGKESPSQYIIV
ncbi:zf-CCHC domain-containing protein [Tanacetum coccineum]|uniref:Zf-CCHC domain-containing protein n=1 Tax=Tanacetum coccineum TaxID=301880 RepID=A0ABQ5HP55_9ASTR